MRYEINLIPRRKGWKLSLANIVEQLGRGLTSPYFMVAFGGALLVAAGYFFVIVPFFRVSPVHKGQVKSLRLMLQDYAARRSEMYMQALILTRIRSQGIPWAEKLAIMAEKLPRGMWLDRVLLEEEKPAGMQRLSPEKAQPEKKRFLMIEGSTIKRKGQSPIEAVAIYIQRLNREPALRKDLHEIQLKGIKADKRHKEILRFQMRAALRGASLMKAESLEKGVQEIIQKRKAREAEQRGQ